MTLAWLEKELNEAPSWLQENPSIKVIGFGAEFPNLQKAFKNQDVSKADLLKRLTERIGKTDEEITSDEKSDLYGF